MEIKKRAVKIVQRHQIQLLMKEKEREKLEALQEYNKNCGIILTLKESARQMRVDISDPKYCEIESKLVDLSIKYHLTKDMAFEVSEKHDACEEALMKFHHEKMKEINR